MRGMSKMLAFLKELRENNDRLWFAERKDYYNALRAECIDEIERILRRASAFDPDLRGVAATDCIYRIYRDIRFSADKRPLKEHFGIVLQKPEVVCRYAAQNNQCIGKRCPFSAANH